MSADVRALLKAKTKERSAQVQHPLAAYNATGQLRCTLCATLVKFGTPAAWKTHLESRGHKASVERQREAERKGKRRADDDAGDGMDVDAVVDGVDSEGGGSSKKRKLDSPAPHPSTLPNGTSFPADFFSDPSRVLPPAPDEDDLGPAQPRTTDTLDAEFEAFERALSKSTRPAPSAMQDLYSRATVAAEPELVDVAALQQDGFPPQVANESAAAEAGNAAEPEKEEETEAQKAKRKELEEKELIMDRILDEERAQEAAEEKVSALKSRFEAIKKQREARKLAAGAKKS